MGPGWSQGLGFLFLFLFLRLLLLLFLPLLSLRSPHACLRYHCLGICDWMAGLHLVKRAEAFFL